MRGDSLRDFYAKTLAVLGLGLLAGAGAIVDYWPVSEELPTTPAVSGLTAAAPILDRNLAVAIPEIPAPVFRPARPRQTEPASFIVADSDFRTIDVAPAATVAVLLDTAPVPQNFVSVKSIPAVPTDEALGLDAPPLPDSMTDESRRLFGDALRRTKERITAARGLINDAMTGVVGAFRKMSPFFTTTALLPGLD